MANQLKMDTVQAIHALHKHGWTNQRIAEELGIHRTTVAAHPKSKPTPVTAASEDGSEPLLPPPRSRREPYRDVIS